MAKGWYIVHTFTGYEQKIQRAIFTLRDSDPDFALSCFDVKIPMEQYKTLDKDGNEITKERKLLPGYILVEIDFPKDEGWQVVYSKIKRISGVTDFVSTANDKKPLPMPAKEVTKIFATAGDTPTETEFKLQQTFVIGEEVKIINGPFESFSGKVDEIDTVKNKLNVVVQIFGRPTSIEVEYSQAEKLAF